MAKQKNIINAEHRGTGLTPLSEGMNPLIKKLLGGKGLIQVDLFSSWKNIVGEEIAAYTAAIRIDYKKGKRDNGTLHLAVENGAFALEIGQQKLMILEKINAYFGYQAVSDIKISINSSFFMPPETTLKDADNTEKNIVNETQQNYIDQVTSGIQDPELKIRLQKLGQSIFKSNK